MDNLLNKSKNTSTQPDTESISSISPSIRPEMPIKKKSSGSGKFKKIALAFIIFLLVIGGSVGFITFVTLAQVKNVQAKVSDLQTSSQELFGAIKNQDLEGSKNKIPQVKEKLTEAKKAVNGLTFIKILPFVNRYHADAIHALNAGEHGVSAIEITIGAIEPYADLLGLKSGSSFVSGSADERIQLAVKTMDKLTPKISEIGKEIDALKKEVDAIDEERYPENFRGMKVRAKIADSKKLLDDTVGIFLNAQPLLEVLPQLLGEPEQKRYLVLFQNDKELRPTGGFITAYAIFKINQGKITVEKSDDIYELDEQVKKKEPAPEKIKTFHKNVTTFNLRDSNLSPDFAESVKLFKSVYPNKWDFDGVIAVDTHVLVESIKILGTFVVKNRTFSTEIDKRCDCPKVIYELEDYSTRPVAYVREDRKDVLGELLLQIMKKALGVSPSQYWGQLMQMAISEINQKHIIAYMEDEKAQLGVESFNMGGRIADGVEVLGYKDGQNWDYLHISDTNFAGQKSNLFVKHAVKQEFTVEGDGSIVKTVTLDYRNPGKASDCNLESGGLCLNAPLRNWIRMYVPKGSTLIEANGGQNPKDESPAGFTSYEELGKTVLEGFVIVRPEGTAQVVVKYKLPFKKDGDKLNQLIQKQGGTDGHEYSIFVNGKQKDQFQLLTDKLQVIKL